MYCCCVSIIMVICICPPGTLIWLINLFLFLFLYPSDPEKNIAPPPLLKLKRQSLNNGIYCISPNRFIFLCSKFRRKYIFGRWPKFFFKLTLHGLRNKCKRVCSLGYLVFSVCRFPISHIWYCACGSHDSMWALPFFQAVWKLYIYIIRWWKSYFKANVFPVPHCPVIRMLCPSSE